MNFPNSASALMRLSSAIDECDSLSDLGAAIEEFSDAMPYQIVHFGVCKIDNTVTKDIIYTTNIAGYEIGPNSFSDELKVYTVNEALNLMEPYDLLTHEFTTCDHEAFAPVRNSVTTTGVEGIIIIPYQHQNTISIVILNCVRQFFDDNMSSILPSIFLLVSKTFARFPSLAKWPEEYKLSDREAQVLHLSAAGAMEAAIAEDLGLSVNTVRNHVENAKRKLDARNKAHAVSLAMQSGEIDSISYRRKK